jgi:hypothetical protein
MVHTYYSALSIIIITGIKPMPTRAKAAVDEKDCGHCGDWKYGFEKI